jgi:outer membrane protein with beta-barrel domain
MKRLVLAFCLLPFTIAAQNFYFSGRLGTAGYLGDLKESVSLTQLSFPMFSIGARYDLNEHIAARGYISLMSLKGDDKKGTAVMQQRNLNFKSKVSELELSAQYSLFSLNDRWWTPYVFAGVAVFHFNPYTKDSAGNKTFLKPLSTEGEGFMPGVDNYKLTQLAIPIGFGAEYSLNEDMRLGIEFGYRKTFTDYIDDVSTVYVDQNSLLTARGQTAVDLAWRGDEKSGSAYPAGGTTRGNSKNNDGYYYIALTFTVRYFFDKYKQIVGLPAARKDKKVGCPATRQ